MRKTGFDQAFLDQIIYVFCCCIIYYTVFYITSITATKGILEIYSDKKACCQIVHLLD